MQPIRLLLLIAAFCITLLTKAETAGTDPHTVYATLDSGLYTRPPEDLFALGLYGYTQLKQSGHEFSKDIITLIDFRKAANEKRLWVIDLANGRILFQTWVAHGRNSGELFATHFSNVPNSHQSSLGFYTTGNIYAGKHGKSLKLHGRESGFNDRAEARAIVIHGADYVSESFIQQVGRLGRSHGCPALPMGLHEQIIDQIAHNTCVFIFYPDARYLQLSRLIPKEASMASPSAQ